MDHVQGYEVWGSWPRCHETGAWRESGLSRVDPMYSQQSITVNKTPTIVNREQNETHCTHSMELCRTLWRSVGTFSRKEGPRMKLNCQAAKGVSVYSPFRYRMWPLSIVCSMVAADPRHSTIQRHWMPPSYSFWFNNSREQRKTYFSCVSTSLTTKTRAIARRKALCCQVLF